MTVWTVISKPITIYSAVSGVSTTYNQLQPIGFGYGFFGDTDIPKEMKIHYRGFGDSKTIWQNV